MTRFETLLAAAAVLLALPAHAHDGVLITDAYARSTGMTGGIFMHIDNHSDSDDRLLSASTEAAEKAELHTHKSSADGVMQMLAVPEGFPIPALQSHALARGGDHIMLMGLTRKLVDGDIITITLTFEHAGAVTVDVPVDNARKPEPMGAMEGMNHGAMAPAN